MGNHVCILNADVQHKLVLFNSASYAVYTIKFTRLVNVISKNLAYISKN